MIHGSLSEVLRAHRAHTHPVSVRFVTGHHSDVLIRAVGSDWFSGETMGSPARGLVVPFPAIQTLSLPAQSITAAPMQRQTLPVISTMLNTLAEGHKKLVAHSLHGHYTGRLGHVGVDYCEFVTQSQTIVLPFAQIGLWFHVLE